jgi:hypothetical protein
MTLIALKNLFILASLLFVHRASESPLSLDYTSLVEKMQQGLPNDFALRFWQCRQPEIGKGPGLWYTGPSCRWREDGIETTVKEHHFRQKVTKVQATPYVPHVDATCSAGQRRLTL